MYPTDWFEVFSLRLRILDEDLYDLSLRPIYEFTMGVIPSCCVSPIR